MRGHGSYVNGAVWSADGGNVYTASSDGTVRVWDAKTCKCMHTFAPPASAGTEPTVNGEERRRRAAPAASPAAAGGFLLMKCFSAEMYIQSTDVCIQACSELALRELGFDSPPTRTQTSTC